MAATTTTKKPEIRNYNLFDSGDMMLLAVELTRFVKENKLFQNVQGKEYVNVEGWQYAGARLGLVPVMQDSVNLSTDTELKYSAKVAIFLISNEPGAQPVQVGAGFAVCSNKENGKKFYQEFAISSMAQTRAVGKAFRNLLSWVMRAAGYEPTPAEEMDYSGNTPEPPKVATNPAAPAQAAKPAPANEPAEEQIHDTADTPHGAPKLQHKEPAPAGLTQPAKDEPVITPPAVVTHGNEKLNVDTSTGEATPTTAAASIKYANAKQKEEIIRLLNNPQITRQEKTKMLLNINKLDEERANQAIVKLRKAIEDREQATA